MPETPNRYFSAIFNTNHASPQFNYGFSATSVITGNNQPTTGAWIPLIADASGRFKVVIDGFTFTGNLEVDNSQVVLALATGLVAAFPSGYGQIGVMREGGFAAVTSGYSPNYASGANAAMAFDTLNGGALIQITDLDRSNDSVTSYLPTATTASNSTPSGSNAFAQITGVILQANPNRIQCYIQNITSGGALYVNLGGGTASTGNYHVLLKAASTAEGADGGIFQDQGLFQGAISVSGQTRFIVWEM